MVRQEILARDFRDSEGKKCINKTGGTSVVPQKGNPQMKGKNRWFKFNGKTVAAVIVSIGVLLTPLSIKYLAAKGSVFYERVETKAETRTTLRIGGEVNGFKLEGELPPAKP